MQTHKPFRQEISQAMNAFMETPLETPIQQTSILKYGSFLVHFMLLSTLNLMTMTWLALQFEDAQRSLMPVLIGFVLIESLLIIGVIWFTPLGQWLKRVSNGTKWD